MLPLDLLRNAAQRARDGERQQGLVGALGALQEAVDGAGEAEAGLPLEKLAPFGEEEGMSFGRKDWLPKGAGSDKRGTSN